MNPYSFTSDDNVITQSDATLCRKADKRAQL